MTKYSTSAHSPSIHREHLPLVCRLNGIFLLSPNISSAVRRIEGGGAIEKVYIGRTRVVNFIKLGGGDLLCTLHRAEGLYSWVTRKSI